MNEFQDFGLNALLLETLTFVARCNDLENIWTLAVGRLKWILNFTRVDVALRNRDRSTYNLQTVFELRPDFPFVNLNDLPLRRGILGNMMRSGVPCWCFDPRIQPPKSEDCVDEGLEGGSLSSILNINLEVNGQSLGVLSFGSIDKNAYCHRDIEVASRFASSIALVIQNRQQYVKLNDDAELLRIAARNLKDAHASLESLVARRTAALRALSQQLLKIQDEERRRIARDLHDSTGQTLVYLKMAVAKLQKQFVNDHCTSDSLTDIAGIADQALQEIRTTSYLLHPPLLDELGLGSATRWYIDGFSRRSRIEARLDCPSEFERLSKDVEMVFFRVLQESLTNIHRHSGASSVDIALTRTAEAACLEVRDNGHGMTPELLNGLENRKIHSGVGLAGMQERINDLNGRMEIKSNSCGTTVRFIVPLAAANRVEGEAQSVSGD